MMDKKWENKFQHLNFEKIKLNIKLIINAKLNIMLTMYKNDLKNKKMMNLI